MSANDVHASVLTGTNDNRGSAMFYRKSMNICLAAAMSVVAFGVAAQNVADPAYADATFAEMDANKDGTISKEEFSRFLDTRVAKQRADFEAAFKATDADGDGFIDKKEAQINAALYASFYAVDANKDGKVSREELTAALAKLAAK